MDSQCTRIAAHLEKGRCITPMEALKKFGCFRLASRIVDLKAQGYNIVKEMVYSNGKKWAKYWIND